LVSDRLKVLLQYLLPKQSLTRLAGRVAGAQGGALTLRGIRWFVGRYGVDMSEAANADIASYRSFNDFFTRPLKAGLRPLADADFVCPVDGAISQFGAIDDHHIVQAKGHRFTTTALVGGDDALAAQFRHGSFANLYLSPKDYHRLHMPCDGTLTRMIYVPGALFSVNPVTARGVPNLFARNERVVCLFESPDHGRVRDGAGRRHYRRQHGDSVAWRGQCDAHRRNVGMDLSRSNAVTLKKGRRNGPFPARLDDRDAIRARHHRIQPRLGAGTVGSPGRTRWAIARARAA
jgi:phosphatidylserine decarboxylase